MIRKVERHLMDKIKEFGAIHIVLIDPEKASSSRASFIARKSEEAGSVALMIGGSTIFSSSNLDKIVKSVKKVVDIPIILFPSNITGVSRHADAIWFMSLLNSLDPYFIIGAQVLAAPLIRSFEIEAIPLGYLIIGDGGAAAVVGKAAPIPNNKPELTVAHALASQYLGMRFIYLEAGSGVSKTVPTDMIQMVNNVVNTPIIVGGGIRRGVQARKIVEAGAEIIVTSTALEETSKNLVDDKIKEMVIGIKEGVKHKHNT